MKTMNQDIQATLIAARAAATLGGMPAQNMALTILKDVVGTERTASFVGRMMRRDGEHISREAMRLRKAGSSHTDVLSMCHERNKALNTTLLKYAITALTRTATTE